MDILFKTCFAAIFNESTVTALRHYDEKGWKETAAFVQLFLNIWNIMNVKSVSKGKA